MILDKWDGIISSQNSRLEVLWDSYIPGNTKQTQWFIEPGSIKLYNNNSKPWKNMQTITFNCEFDSTTNLAPNYGQAYDQAQAAGTDPVLLEYISTPPVSPQLTKFNANIPAAGQTLNTLATLNYGTDEPLTSNTQPYPSHYKLYALHVFTTGSNKGSYLISNHTIGMTDVITIYGTNVPAGLKSAFVTAQSGVECGIELFDHYIPIDTAGISGWLASSPDIQTDLQTNPGVFTLTATLHTWASEKSGSILHKFQIIPYWLLESRLLANTIVPTWSFTCKCVIRETDISGSYFTGLWE